MGYTQLIPFDTNKGGNQKGYCLKNVRLGYGLPAHFPSAWECWKNTDQHTDAIPKGLDVPVYFSYGVDGHIGVRLANGTFWSDGSIFASIDAYTQSHAPKYVGWSMSVESKQVIKESKMDETDKKNVYRLGLHREPESDKAWQGLPDKFSDASDSIRKSDEWLTQNHILLLAYPTALNTIEELKKENADLKKQLAAVQSPAQLKPGVYQVK